MYSLCRGNIVDDILLDFIAAVPMHVFISTNTYKHN